MNFVLHFEGVTKADRPRVGGKGYALIVLARAGAKVPSGVCVTADAYSTINDDWQPRISPVHAVLAPPNKESGDVRISARPTN